MANSGNNDLLVRIDATVAPLRNNLKAGERDVAGFRANIEKSLAGIDGAFSGLRSTLGALGISIGAFSLARIGLDALKSAGDLGELAQQLGIGTDTLQTFQFAATQVGVSQEEMQTGLAKLTRTVGEAAEGNKTAIQTFNKLGVGILDANGKIRSTDDIILDVADALSKIQDPAARAAAEVDLFGRAGQKLDTIFSNGRGSIEDFNKEAERLGLILSPEQIKNADDAADAIARLSFRWDRLKESIAANLALPILNFFDEMSKEAPKVNFRLLQAEQYKRSIAGLPPLNPVSGRTGPSGLVGSTPTMVFPTHNPTLPNPAAEQAAKKLESALHDLNMEVDALTGTDSADRLAKWLDKAGIAGDNPMASLFKEGVDQLERADIATKGLAAARDADREATQKWEAVQKEGAALTESMRTPLEAYNATLDKAAALLNRGAINQDTFNRVVDQAGDAFVAADERSQLLVQSANQIGESFVTAFSRIATEGDSLKDVLRSLLQTLAQIAGNAAGNGLQNWLTNLNKGGLSNTSLLTDINGSLPGRAFGGPVLAGMPYRVGERGRSEVFVPSVNGMIVPGTGAGVPGGITINMPVTVNSNAGTPAQNTDQAAKIAGAFDRQVTQRIVNVIIDQLRGGGVLRPNVV